LCSYRRRSILVWARRKARRLRRSIRRKENIIRRPRSRPMRRLRRRPMRRLRSKKIRSR